MKKEKSQKPNKNKLGTWASFRELLWRGAKAQNVYTVTNSPCINSFDIKYEYYTVVHKCFENDLNLRM